jgi:hypothetical protein
VSTPADPPVCVRPRPAFDEQTGSSFRAAVAALVLTFSLVPAAGLLAQTAPVGDLGGARCEAGVISQVEVRNASVFDPASTDHALLSTAYRLANLPHVRTREGFIRSELLVGEGDCFDPFLVAESQRLLTRHRFLARASIRPEDDGSGGVRLVVETRDEWSLQVDLGASWDDGFQLQRFRVAEQNFAGRGISADVRVVRDRDRRNEAFRLHNPRLIGRLQGTVGGGRNQRGGFFQQSLDYPFVGEVGRTSARQGMAWGTEAFVYAAGEEGLFSHFLAPHRREHVELHLGRRFGELATPMGVGVSATWWRQDFDLPLEVVVGGDFGAPSQEGAPGLDGALARQVNSEALLRLLTHFSLRNLRYREYRGLDAVDEVQSVGLGSYLGASAGVSIGRIGPPGSERVALPQGRIQGDVIIPLGASLLRSAASVEGRWNGGWQDVLAEASVAGYGRHPGLPGHTLFVRAGAAGGWDTRIPFQLWLGGTRAVRALPEYAHPGGRIVHLTVEDRVAFPLPSWAPGDLGMTLFADAGRVWPGDAPFGRDSGWRGGVGAGLRMGFPRGSGTVYRADLVFPVGSGSRDPIFRITFETNRMQPGFGPAGIDRSRRTDHF